MATLTTATNSLSKAAQHLHDSLANSAQFQLMTSAADATQAATHIYLDALPCPDSVKYARAEIEKLRPFALINTESYHGILEAPPAGFGHSGVLALRLFRSVADEIASKPGEIGRRFDNSLGTLLAELEAQCGTAGRLAFEDYDMGEPWDRTAEEEKEIFGDSLKALITFSWSGL